MRRRAMIEIICDACEKERITLTFSNEDKGWDNPQIWDALRAAGWSLLQDDPMCLLQICPKCCGGNIEPSGVIFSDACTIQTDRCTAREKAAVTAVWGPPGRTQINVCGSCLQEKVRIGEWKIGGA
jgi:hypothetical protein